MNTPVNRTTRFVEYLFRHSPQDNALAARLRRGDNPATEYQCWDTLAAFGVNLEHEPERLAFALIAAAVARSKQSANGELKIGQAIARAFDEGSKSSQAEARLRRLLACQDSEEVCRILRPLLRLLQSRVMQPIDYAALLTDLVKFHSAAARIKASWAQQFYSKLDQESQEVV
ncbi:type I-E CRISPR-associated protein Cse2/CasB [Serratia microhaemolytica]|uniref:type I-E CRISPR-associated protein Cse2/CasB n=1 Tax=Serratia microhaemolytica TaxID=2675110 RepID=UPI000FDE3895|nr:type I-E CRISPR-associated protein Cse2/CasB [Serratia microhaemolytica]